MRIQAKKSLPLLLLITAVIVLVSSACGRKAPERKKTGFVWENSKGTVYDICITEKGSCYILVTSEKTGKQYERYLPKEISQEIKKAMKEQMLDSSMVLLGYKSISKDSVDLRFLKVPEDLTEE